MDESGLRPEHIPDPIVGKDARPRVFKTTSLFRAAFRPVETTGCLDQDRRICCLCGRESSVKSRVEFAEWFRNTLWNPGYTRSVWLHGNSANNMRLYMFFNLLEKIAHHDISLTGLRKWPNSMSRSTLSKSIM